MTLKRLTIIVNTSMVAAFLLTLILCNPLAEFIYLRFLYQGLRQDLTPGDGIGVFIVWMMLVVFAWVALLFLWARLYRTVLRRQ